MVIELARLIPTVLAHLKIQPANKFKPEISDIEQILADKLSRYSAVKWYQQVPFTTPFCDFFLDMGCSIRPGHAIGVECDGREYHRDPVRDFCRDALILGTGRLACIYRIEAWAILKREFDWLRILSVLEPGLFDCERLQTIKELGYSHDELTGQQLRDRYTGFIFRRVPEMESVNRFLEFARANLGITFPELVNRARTFSEYKQSRNLRYQEQFTFASQVSEATHRAGCLSGSSGGG